LEAAAAASRPTISATSSEEDRRALRLEAGHLGEQTLGLVLAQGGGGLVEDEDAAGLGQGGRHGQHLPLPHAQPRHGPVRVQRLEPDAGEERKRPLVERPAIQQTEPARQGGEEHLLGRGQRIDERQLLQDDPDAARGRVGFAPGRIRLTR
jgi:hypothetical protein